MTDNRKQETIDFVSRLSELSCRSRVLSEQLSTERDSIYAMLKSSLKQRYVCYSCQRGVPLSMIVFNDTCRHCLCRICFPKVQFKNPSYECLLCQRVPSVLAVLSPGVTTTATTAVEQATVTTTASTATNNATIVTDVDSVVEDWTLQPVAIGYRLHVIENEEMC